LSEGGGPCINHLGAQRHEVHVYRASELIVKHDAKQQETNVLVTVLGGVDPDTWGKFLIISAVISHR
jgi:hypothetical protein